MTDHPTDPIVIGAEQIQAAARVLGITDLTHVQEVRVAPDRVTVSRYVVEGGRRVYIADGWVTEESTIPVVVDEDTETALSARTDTTKEN